MIHLRFSQEADKAAERYGILIEAWRGQFQRAVSDVKFGPARINQAVADAYGIARAWLAEEEARIERASLEIVKLARRQAIVDLKGNDAPELPDELSEHLSDAEAYLRQEMLIQIERDIAFLKQSLTRALLEIRMSARAQSIGQRSAAVQWRMAQNGELAFFFHDRQARKWSSRRFIRTVWRLHLLSLFNETVLLTVVEHNRDNAFVFHPSAKAEVHGMEITVNGGSALPVYSEIRSAIFHPNADAVLRASPDVFA